jgi:hypothetical protein
MTWKFSDICKIGFCFFFSAFFAFHFAYMKAPSQDRTIASQEHVAKPWYDASFKY